MVEVGRTHFESLGDDQGVLVSFTLEQGVRSDGRR